MAAMLATLFELFGGQGTINVPNWSPDGEEFAYVRYEPALSLGKSRLQTTLHSQIGSRIALRQVPAQAGESGIR